jgi:hypothetical protein
MSRRSRNHHVRAPQPAVIVELVAKLWSEPDTVDVDVIGVEEAMALEEGRYDPNTNEHERCWAISPNVVDPFDPTSAALHPSDWTILSGTYGYDDTILAHLAATLRCDALYGHLNDSIDDWRWLRFRAGALVDQYWYQGQEWVRFPDRVPRPTGALTLSEAFASMGRTYGHESYRSALFRALQLPPELRDAWRVVRAVERVDRRLPNPPPRRVGVAVSGGSGADIAPPPRVVRESEGRVRVAVCRGWESGFGGVSRAIGEWMLERLAAGIDDDGWLEGIDAGVAAMRPDFEREFASLCEDGAFADFGCVSIEVGVLEARWIGGAQIVLARRGGVAHRVGPDTVRQMYLEAEHSPEEVAQLPDVWTRAFTAEAADVQRLAPSWLVEPGDVVVFSMGGHETLGIDVAEAAVRASPDALARTLAGATASEWRPRAAVAIRIGKDLCV